MTTKKDIGIPWETILLFGSIIGFTTTNFSVFIWIVTAVFGNYILFRSLAKNRVTRKGILTSYPILILSLLISTIFLSDNHLWIYISNVFLGLIYMYLLHFSGK